MFLRIDSILVGCHHLALDVQDVLGGHGVRHHRQVTVLETMMAGAIISCLDFAFFAWIYGLTGVVTDGTTAARGDLANDQRGVASIGKMKRIGHHLTLQQSAEIMLRLLKSDGSLLFRFLGGRLGVGHQIGGEASTLITIATSRKQTQGKNQK